MKTNPGGQISSSEVIGRDKLIQSLWRILERQSLVLIAERRMGKTCVVKKMVEEAPQSRLSIYHDLEGIRTPLEFSELVFRDVEAYLSRLQRVATRARQGLAHLTGLEIGDLIKLPEIMAPHWKTLLTKTIEDLVEHQDRVVVFFWDEMPLMLYNIKKRDGEGAAMEVLDTLRSMRQMHRDLRMVFTGSIGLHNVISSLKRVGYANEPTNDMNTVEVPPLLPTDAQELARRLLDGENIRSADPRGAAKVIAGAVDGIPYYIHHVIDQIVRRGGVANRTAVNGIVNSCLTDSNDSWDMGYYSRRIPIYYLSDECPFALGLLDILSASDQPLGFDDLFNRLKSRQATEDIEMTREVLILLQRDHYVIQQKDGRYQFRFPLIQRWWRIHRGLTS